jgi:TonB family protein
MAPSALVLAVLLHVLIGLALWWMALNRPQVPPAEDVIDITIEQPKPPEPPPPTPKQEAQPPPPPVDLGLRPPAPIISDKPTQVPQAPQSKEPPAPAPPPEREAVPTPQAQPPPPTPKPAPAPAPSQLAAPSPLSMAPQRRPPAAPSAEPPSPHAFVNPADVYSRARLTDNYLWQVARKLSGYRYQAHVTAREGLTVVRIVIARDGRLLDVAVIRSSGVPEFDRGVLAGVRAGSPYAPLPPEIQGDRASFDLPLVSVNRQ